MANFVQSKLKLWAWFPVWDEQQKDVLWLAEDELLYGKTMEEQRGAGGDMLQQKRDYLQSELTALANRNINVLSACEWLAHGRSLFLSYLADKRDGRNFAEWADRSLIELERLVSVSADLAASRFFSKDFKELLHQIVERAPNESNLFDLETVALRGKGHPGRPSSDRRPWRRSTEANLQRLGIGRESRRRLLSIVGLAKLLTFDDPDS